LDQLKDDVDKLLKIYNKETNETLKNEDQEMHYIAEEADKLVQQSIKTNEKSESDKNLMKQKDVESKAGSLDELNQINSENQISSTPIFVVSSKTNEPPFNNQPVTLNNEIDKNMLVNPVVDNFQFDVAHAIQCKK
jgi:hypothetical protein